MAYPASALKEGLGQTLRRDMWWANPAAMAASFLVFVVYATWAALQPVDYAVFGPYRSPFYSPDMSKYFPGFPWSPAFMVIWLPAAFRLTCYYGRKAYYRSIMMSPPACAVGKGGRGYQGERALPWVLNNLHRYFLYIVLVLVAFHWIHFIEAYNFEGHFGMAIGSLVISADTFFLTLYVVSCHSLRHLVGGNLDCFSCAAGGPARHAVWTWVSKLNEYHNVFFWCSLFTVGFADFYVRMCAMNLWTDVRIF